MNLIESFKDDGERLRHRAQTLLVLVVIAFAAGAFDDDLTPFKSFFFILGSAAIYYGALHFGLLCSLGLASGMSTVMLAQSLIATDTVAQASFQVVEVPLALSYFLFLAVIPAIVPAMLGRSLERLRLEREQLVEREKELEDGLAMKQREGVDERRDHREQVDLRFSSRSATLVSFSREAVRAESPGEVVHLAFRTFCRSLGNVEVVEIAQGDRPGSLLVERFFPPKRKDLAERLLPADDAILSGLLKTGAASAFREGAEVAGAFSTHILAPLAWQRNLLCIFSFHWLDGPLDGDDQEYVQTLLAVAQGCITRLARRKSGRAR